MSADRNPLRLGILGAANIARLFTRGVAGSPLVTVEAVASRDAAKASEFARSESIPRALGSYEALLADPAIEAIYIPLPNDLHAEWAIKAAAAGKHVLCEKPLAMTGAEARHVRRCPAPTASTWSRPAPTLQPPDAAHARIAGGGRARAARHRDVRLLADDA